MKKISLFPVLILCVLAAQAQQTMTFRNAETISVKLVGISRVLRDVPETPVGTLKSERVEHENNSLKRPPVDEMVQPTGPDEALQKNYATPDNALSVATVLSSWAGLAANVDPSDNNIAVSANYVMQMTNNSSSTFIKIWNKSGTVLVNNKLVQSITGINDFGDPDVVYDWAADRFAFVVLYSGSASKLVVCVSQTNDPTGAYYVYTLTTSNGFPDYPKIGVWGNSYFITTNSNTPTIFALNRSAMLTGAALGSAQVFKLSSFPKIGFQSSSPITQTGTMAPPAGEPAMVVRVADDQWGASVGSDHIELYQIVVDWAIPANSSITGPINLSTIAYNSKLCSFGSENCIPQKGSTQKLDPLSDIVMDKVQYRNFTGHESIVCSNVCNSDGNGTAGIRWYELRRTGTGKWKLHQQGTYQPTTDDRWMSSITINQNGAIAMGYNIASAALFPGVSLTGRLSADPVNTMTVPEINAQAGAAANSSNRYGDYNSIVTDPADGSFWLSGQYNPTSSWGTQVIHFKLGASTLLLSDIIQTGNSISGFSIAPNPAANQLTVSFGYPNNENANLQIVDLSGKIVLQQAITIQSGFNQSILNLSSLENGYYILRLQTSSGSLIHKLIIQH